MSIHDTAAAGHTRLRANGVITGLERLCGKAKEYGFALNHPEDERPWGLLRLVRRQRGH